MASKSFGAEGALIAQITLFAVLIYELVGPMLTKIALTKAGDINPEGKTNARHEHAKNKARHGFFHRHAKLMESDLVCTSVETQPQDNQQNNQ